MNDAPSKEFKLHASIYIYLIKQHPYLVKTHGNCIPLNDLSLKNGGVVSNSES